MSYANPEDQRAACRAHYLKNRESYKRKARANEKRHRIKRAEAIKEIKERTPCADCRQFFPYFVLQFDHVGDDKEFNIGDANRRGYSMKRIIAEIQKCEVVCANCHAIRTHNRRTG
jgi:hypothetical protein